MHTLFIYKNAQELSNFFIKKSIKNQFFICLFLIFADFCHAEYKYQVSICAIFQDEAPYLKEWIEFHRLLGVEHFYLYNHQSHDNYQEVLQPYILEGLVELSNKTSSAKALKAFNSLQCKSYTECLRRTKGMSKWVAFLDIDEFLFPLQEQSLQEILKDYEEFGGLGVNWLVFGPSHIWKIPNHQLLIETLTLCADQNFSGNRYVKSVVRPERVSHFTNPHQPVYKKGYQGVNCDKMPLLGMWGNYLQNHKLRINHYWTRDGDYFYSQKIQRHKRWRGNPESQAIQEFIQNLNTNEDEAILRFVPALKKHCKSPS
jgi:hypothetical protein